MNFGGAPGGVLLLVGPTGSSVQTLELHYQDGRTEDVPLHNHWALYEIPESDYARGRRPDRLIGRDASGAIVATKVFPWR